MYGTNTIPGILVGFFTPGGCCTGFPHIPVDYSQVRKSNEKGRRFIFSLPSMVIGRGGQIFFWATSAALPYVAIIAPLIHGSLSRSPV